MAILGDLEHQIMTCLWASESAMSVRDVHQTLLQDRDLAYTTVMTVLDRLSKKRLVARELDGRAWLYRAAVDAPELVANELVEVLRSLPEQTEAALVAFAGRLDDAEASVLRQRLS